MAIDEISDITPIKLSQSNPFSNGEQIVFNDGEGILRRTPIDYTPKEKDNYHTIQAEDNLYKIAWMWYKDEEDIPSRWWWAIAEANSEIIFNPLDLSDLIGTEILIPNLTNFKLINT